MTTLGEKFCRRLIDAMPTPQARMICTMELSKWAGKTLYLPTTKRGKRRVDAARNLLDNEKSRAEAALIIHERFGITLRQAQRDVKTAADKSSCTLSQA